MNTRNLFFTILFSLLSISLVAQNMSGVRIYIDPGHGGWGPNDRGIPTPLFPNPAPFVGFWESQANLVKAFHLRDLLEPLGADIMLSRDTTFGGMLIPGAQPPNHLTPSAGLPLATIVRQANEFNADFMLSIHSNAGGGAANHVLMLFAGRDLNDTHNYPNLPPQWAQDTGREISTQIARNIFGNQLTVWTENTYRVQGDKTFGRLFMGGWSDGFGVLRGLQVPGLISEPSMHDYIPETYRLMSDSYKWLEAWNFLHAFVSYFTDEEIPTGNIAGWVKCDRLHLVEEGPRANYRRFGTDYLLPLCGATVTLKQAGIILDVYTVDTNRNGVFAFRSLQPGTYTILAEMKDYYPFEQEVVVERNEITYFNFRMERIRNTPLEVVEHLPLYDALVDASTEIRLQFNWDVDEESAMNAFSITPHADGEFTFEDNHYRMRFRPNAPLEPATVYTIRLNKSAQHLGNIGMDEDFVFQFTTKNRNRLALIEAYPFDGVERVETAPTFRLIFDRRLNSQSARNGIRVLDDAGVSLNIPTISVRVNNVPAPYGDIQFGLGTARLQPNREYRIVIDGDVRDEVDMQIVEPIEIRFTTADVATNHGTVLEDFSVAGTFVFDEGMSHNVTTASAARATTPRLFNPATTRFRATFTNENAQVTFRVADPIATVNSGQVIGMHIHGDMSSNEIQLLFDGDSGEQIVEVGRLRFVGWRFVEVDLSSLPSGESFTFTGVRVVRKDGVLSGTLDINLDNMLLYSERLFEEENWLFASNTPEITATQITIYPNPVSDMLFVRTESNEIPQLQIYSFGGHLLKEARANEISVADLSTGTYVLVVKTGTGIHRTPIIVVR